MDVREDRWSSGERGVRSRPGRGFDPCGRDRGRRLRAGDRGGGRRPRRDEGAVPAEVGFDRAAVRRPRSPASRSDARAAAAGGRAVVISRHRCVGGCRWAARCRGRLRRAAGRRARLAVVVPSIEGRPVCRRPSRHRGRAPRRLPIRRPADQGGRRRPRGSHAGRLQRARRLASIGDGYWPAACGIARDLANCPPAHLTAEAMAAVAERLGGAAGLGVEVFDKPALWELGCGGLLGVNAGSTRAAADDQADVRPDGATPRATSRWSAKASCTTPAGSASSPATPSTPP